MNEWSNNKTIKIEVLDFYLNPRTVTWQGQSVRVGDFDLFTGIIKQWMEEMKWSKQRAISEYFSAI